jgi:type IV pilus assembly protein PilO
VQQYVTQLEKQLPSKAEMSALLSDINQAGLGAACSSSCSAPARWWSRSTTPSCRSIRVTGKYHDIGAFASDVASRIVTLNNLPHAGATARW